MRFRRDGRPVGMRNVPGVRMPITMGIPRQKGGQRMRILTVLHSVAASRHGDRGAVSAEYALLASLIAVVIIAAVIFLGGSVLGLFNETASSFADF